MSHDAIKLFCPLLSPSPPTFYHPSNRVLSSESFFTSGGQSIRASASPTVLPMNILDWFPLGSNALISLQSKGLLRVFSSTTVWKHQFFRVQTSLWSNSHIHTWLPEKPVLTKWTILSKVMPLPFNTLSRFVIAYFLRSKCLNFMATVTICSDFGAQGNKNLPSFPLFTHLYAMKWWDQCHDLHFCMFSFKLAFLLSSFTFIKRLFSSSSWCKGDVICISEVIYISPGNFDSRLYFIQSGISHDVLCI